MTLEQLLIEDFSCSHPLLDEPRRRKNEGDEVRYLSRYGQRYYSKLVKLIYDLCLVVPDAFSLEQAQEIVETLDDIAAGYDPEALYWPEPEKSRALAKKDGAKR